ncbi:hypothetical protein VSR17_17865 [Cupriavidus taiwanensis]|uniref:hypothetical protein n=1 Tax=Cupriavidus taiwanensis TaxID=164546 RepID=UPI000E10BAC4|nr:hypothetical protein [Cupriavidus taiwanensis]SOY42655.1 membrane associated precursor, exported and processed into extracellular protein EXP [Cupriavidus taiwanensis]SOY44774.1 membrane associated precursor, exported and processed into extracellular protein EXP [Cupriavidus taiwanensis]SOY80664.1 membrane associated precursor, exported and processed into extracellular protein EXP [Cupriavidus taiwanensis]SOZ21568.1 membrane associated precursor, exported and processed into extracellular pro
MQTKTRKIFVLGIMAGAAATLVACGGGDDAPAPSQPSQPSATVSGKAVDFYLSGSTVTFLDCDNKTAVTNATGDFTFPAGCSKSALKVTGGTDVGTKLPFAGVLQAAAIDYREGVTQVVSPLTTLALQLGAGQAAPLATGLGLAGKDLATLDPMQDAQALRAAVVVQQLVDHVAKTLTGLGEGGTLTPADSAAAASKAVATAVAGAPGTADLSSGALVAGVVSSAVQNAQAGLPASLQANIGAVATNVAALAAPVIASEVDSVSTALEAIDVSSSPTETLSALIEGGSINIVTQSAQTTTTALVQAVSPSALANAANAAGLAQLGGAVSSGSAAQIQQVAANLGGVVDAGAINSVADAVRLKNSLVLSNLTINGVTQPITDTITATGGSLDAIQVAVAQNGDAFNGGPTQVRAGLSYTYNGNQVDVIIENVTLTFNGSQLVNAVVPANTAYSFRVSGSLSVAASLTNAAADSLFSSANGGSLNLPFTTFLGKLRSSGALSQAQVDALTPKATSTFPVTFATTTGLPGRDVRVGMLVNNDVAFAKTALVKTDAEMVVGDGLKTTVTLNP